MDGFHFTQDKKETWEEKDSFIFSWEKQETGRFIKIREQI